jgi:hypothetical protein
MMFIKTLCKEWMDTAKVLDRMRLSYGSMIYFWHTTLQFAKENLHRKGTCNISSYAHIEERNMLEYLIHKGVSITCFFALLDFVTSPDERQGCII